MVNSIRLDLMYYWVNQGKTYFEEKEGEFLWAPLKDKGSKTPFHWRTMAYLKKDDIVFNYYKGEILGYCIVQNDSYKFLKPTELKNDDYEWSQEGLIAEAKYFKFENSIDIKKRIDEFKSNLPQKYSPVSLNGKTPSVNQGYLYKISEKLGERLLEMANINFNSNFDTNNEQIPNAGNTSKQGLVTTRVGQGTYRRNLLRRWNYMCAVTKTPIKDILIASHIKPWSESSDEERLDIENGILLSPIYDALFDRYYISFQDNGEIILSKRLKKFNLKEIGITGNEKIESLNDKNKFYLQHHRKKLN